MARPVTAIMTTIIVVFAAAAAAASPCFPMVAGATWILEDSSVNSSMSLVLGAEQIWHDRYCRPRFESVDDSLVGVSYWSDDASGRVYLHGLRYVSTGHEYFFEPPVLYHDAGMAAGEILQSQANVWEAQAAGDLWHGDFTVELTCVSTGWVAVPFGVFPAISHTTVWIDSPDTAPWRYANDSVFTYAESAGPARIVGGGRDYQLTELQGIAITAAPDLAVATMSAAPNPFNPATVLRYHIPSGARQVSLQVYDQRGRLVRELEAAPEAGWQEARWDGRDSSGSRTASGLYFAKLTVDGVSQVQKMALVK